MCKVRSRGRRWAWAVWAAAIAFFSIAPPEWTLGGIPRAGWSAVSAVGHVCEFAILCALLWLAFDGRPARGRLGWASVLALGAGLVVELVQWPLPYRSFDPLDLLADAAGVGMALAGVSGLRLLREAPEPRR